MSGAKFFIPMLAADVVMMTEAANETAFQSAATRRRLAAEAERESRLQASRDVCLVEMRDAYVMLQQRDALAPQEAQRLRAECDVVHQAIGQAQSDREIREIGTRIPDLLFQVTRAVQLHRNQADWTARQAEAQEAERQARQYRIEVQRANTELYALLAGLRADPMLMRWHAQAVGELGTEIESLAGTEQAIPFLVEASDRAGELILEAKAAQLRADQRDYVARSIMQSLAGMGFLVSEPADEHPAHPSTAKIVQAANSSGRSIAVSVPVEGEVWYEVDGYLKTTEARVGGGTALACDEGEQVLLEMHERLNAEFHVEAGELRWEDKDPQRILRKAEQLPAVAPEQAGKRTQ